MIVFKDLNSVEPYLKFKLFYEEALSKGQEIIEAVCISSYSVDEKEVDARFINLKEVNLIILSSIQITTRQNQCNLFLMLKLL